MKQEKKRKKGYSCYKEVAFSISFSFFLLYSSNHIIVLKNEQILELGEIKNIIGLKFTYTNFHFLQDLILKMKLNCF